MQEATARTVPQGSTTPNQTGSCETRSTRVVALDGPAGTGKSSVARGVAAALGWRFVDTGATYRAITLAVLRAGADPEDAAAVLEAARHAHVALVTNPSEPAVFLNDEDVSNEIRGGAVTAAVSAVSSVPAVRHLLVALQQDAIGAEGAVVEGRDIATVVAPEAAVKVFLDARPEIRAARRATDISAQGASAASVAHALATRDARDNQTNALVPSGGAVHLDTSDLTLEQVVLTIVAMVHEAGLHP